MPEGPEITLLSQYLSTALVGKQILNISQQLKIDIIFNYNITLNIKEITPFMKNPKMKESIEFISWVTKHLLRDIPVNS